MKYGDLTTIKPGPGDLYDARRNARINTTQEAADVCGIHRTSYERQEKGQSRVNVTVFRLLLMRAGWLPDPFEGWSIGQGSLWTPEDVRIDPGEIRALPYLYAMIADLRRRLGERPAPVPAELANVLPFRVDSGI